MGLSAKQEGFCLSYVETGNASEAYRRNYNCGNMKPETINRAAKQLMDNPKITTRVKELMDANRKRHEITIDTLTEEIITDRNKAREMEKPEVSLKANMDLAKLHGLLIDKSTVKSEGEVILRINTGVPRGDRD